MKFNETFYLIRDGHKTCTSRVPYKRWFDWYDHLANVEHKIFEAVGPLKEDRIKLKLLACQIHKLDFVAYNLYYQEGLENPLAFIDIWKKIYKSFNPNSKVTTLFFEKV